MLTGLLTSVGISKKKAIVCYIEQNKILLASSESEYQHLSFDAFNKSQLKYNAWLIAAVSSAYLQEDYSNQPLSITTVTDTSVYDYAPNPLNQHINLNFNPQGTVGSAGLFCLGLSIYNKNDTEHMIVMLKDRILVAFFSEFKLQELNVIKLRYTEDSNALLSQMIPKLIQLGIRIGDSSCLLFYQHGDYSKKTINAICKPLHIANENCHHIDSYPKWLMKTWISHREKVKPFKISIPLPILPNTSIVLLAIIWSLLWVTNHFVQVSSPPKSEKNVDTSIMGSLNHLGVLAKKSPLLAFEVMKQIPSSSQLIVMSWQPNKIFLKGTSQKANEAHLIQSLIHNELKRPFSMLPLKFQKTNDKRSLFSKWHIGEKK